MFIVGNFLAAMALVLRMLLDAYWWLIVASVVISWVQADPYNPIVRFLQAATDPVLYRVRRWLPLSFGGIDFSPILVIAAIYFLEKFLVGSLLELSYRFH